MNGKGSERSEHVRHLVQACVDGELPAASAQRVRAHAAVCPECGRALAAAERTWIELAAGAAPEQPRPAWAELRARLEARRRSRVPFAVGALATAAAGLLIGLLVGRTLPAGAAGDEATTALLAQDGSLLIPGGVATLDSLFLAAGQSLDDNAEVRP